MFSEEALKDESCGPDVSSGNALEVEICRLSVFSEEALKRMNPADIMCLAEEM